ncbi:MAG: nitronate monooxygenase [Clostridia bacterium]|nr:nitronate monooxygenase [Clostridia bacterium]MDQ7792317.1 nitronate monooxygenase [Clostridia bacterium]
MQFPDLRIGHLKPKYPIIQGGMALRVSTAPLAAAVANAGGIGIIGATGLPHDELREEIRKAKRLSKDGIIGVNIMFAIRDFAEMVAVAIQEKIDVIFTGAGFSRDIFAWGKEAGTPIVTIVSSARLAKLAEKQGASAVVAEGFEAGGHLGTDRSTKEIVPEIKATVNIPVIAAGGIVDGRDIAEMVRLGADGVQMATRFVLSEECTVSDAFKQHYLSAREEDVVIIKSPVGMPGRAIRNPFSERIAGDEAPKPVECRKCLKVCSKEYCIIQALDNSRLGKIDEGVVFSGKNVFKIKEILPVRKIFEKLIGEFREA